MSLDLAQPGAAPRRLTDPAFANGAAMDKKATRLIVSRSSPTPAAAGPTSPTQAASASPGSRRTASTPAIPMRPISPATCCRSFGTIKAADGTTALLQDAHPAEAGSGQALSGVLRALWRPALADRDQGLGRRRSPQYLVDQGYIYFEIDNRGSANRGVAFEKPIYRAMGGGRSRGPESRRRLF